MDDQKSVEIFVLTGELSGDKLGFEILKDLAPTVGIEGVLGPHLKSLGISQLLEMDALNFMGILRPISSLRKIFRAVKKIQNRILELNPKIVLLIDLPDINLRLAKRLKAAGYSGKIIQVVCPTIWAWRPKRKQTLEKYYDHLFCLFPFERDLFKNSNLKVSYIGHPLNNITPSKAAAKNKILALFPGSRKQEVLRLLPLFLAACKDLTDFSIHVSVAKDSLLSSIKEITKGFNVTLRSPHEKDSLIEETSFALAKNGTINLELALHHVPQITCYSISKLERYIYEYCFSLKLPHYSLPNILLKKRAVPELIGPFCLLKNVQIEITNLINDPYISHSMLQDYAQLSTYLKKQSTADPKKLIESLL